MRGEEFWHGEMSDFLIDTKALAFWPLVISIVVLIVAVVAIMVLVMMPVQTPEGHDVEVTESVDERQSRRVPRRFRSLSVSVDVDLSEHVSTELGPIVSNDIAKTSWERQQQRVLAGASDRYRTVSTNYIERYRLLHHADCADLTVWKMKGMEMLRRVPEAFPFQSLPNDCRLTVFSFLSATDRGIAAQVCSSWRDLIRSPTLWTVIDFNNFAFCKRCAKLGRNCTPLCYAAYKSRLKSFFKFLTSVRPTIRRLRASFDIGDHRDGWLELLQVSISCTC
jgi:F-box-like